jgi:hypothetical protein
MAIFGRDTLKEAERYTRNADQVHLAEAAMHLLETGTKHGPTAASGGTFSVKS